MKLISGIKPATSLAIWGEVGKHIPHNAHNQMVTAVSIEPAIGGALMPDAHYGYSCPIGGIVALGNAVSPWYVGVDISCMLMFTVLAVGAHGTQEFLKNRDFYAQQLRSDTAFGVGVGFKKSKDHDAMYDDRWQATNLLRGLKSRAQYQLGSSGGGNHFADLLIGNFVKDGLGFSKDDQFVALMTHSGSRGPGARIADHYMKAADVWTHARYKNVPKQYGWLELDTDLGIEYWDAMSLMGEYAYANHEIIHQSYLRSLGRESIATIWNRHNFAWKTDKGIIHRKGATPAGKNVLGIIPGTSGSNSYLVEGLGNKDSFESSSHGAGRPHSRTHAIKTHDSVAYQQLVRKQNVLHFGVAKDETAFAYKDIEEIIELQKGTLINPVAVMKPSVVIMGGGKRGRRKKRRRK